MEGSAAFVRGLDGRAELVERPDAPARAAMRVLEHDDAARAELLLGADVLRCDPACFRLDALHHEPRVDRRPAPLVDQHMRVLFRQEQRARLRLRAQRRLVRHRRGREEERRLLAEELGHTPLQLVDARILEVLLVTDLRRGHRGEHCLRRPRERVGAEVDHGPDATVTLWT